MQATASMMQFKKTAVIVAGGSGTRMGSATPKQFLLLKGKPLLWYTIRAFLDAYADMQIVLVLPEAHMETGKAIAGEFSNAAIQIIAGGDTRFASVKNGVMASPDDTIIFVHDGVRCLVTPELIRACYTQTVAKGSAVPAVASTDSVRLSAADGSHRVVDRQFVQIIQTPQTFPAQQLKAAFQQAYQDGFTDEATVVEAAGGAVHLIGGDYSNIKVTRPIDLLMAERILEERNSL